jgi:hypothetical protein
MAWYDVLNWIGKKKKNPIVDCGLFDFYQLHHKFFEERGEDMLDISVKNRVSDISSQDYSRLVVGRVNKKLLDIARQEYISRGLEGLSRFSI